MKPMQATMVNSATNTEMKSVSNLKKICNKFLKPSKMVEQRKEMATETLQRNRQTSREYCDKVRIRRWVADRQKWALCPFLDTTWLNAEKQAAAVLVGHHFQGHLPR